MFTVRKVDEMEKEDYLNPNPKRFPMHEREHEIWIYCRNYESKCKSCKWEQAMVISPEQLVDYPGPVIRSGYGVKCDYQRKHK